MVRRWSYINNWNEVQTKAPIFNKRFKINVFKSAVNFKRFNIKITKFKRKSIARIKHHSAWLFYTYFLNFWIKDFLCTKHYYKFQYYNKIFINNFSFFNFNFSKIRNNLLSYNFNFFFSIWTKKSYNYYIKTPSNLIKFNSIVTGWYNNTLLPDDSYVPVLANWDQYFYSFENNNNTFSFPISNFLTEFFLLSFFKNIIEIRKIIILLYLNKLHNKFIKLNKHVSWIIRIKKI